MIKNIAYIQNNGILTNELIKKYMGNIKYLSENDYKKIYKFIVCCNKCYKITNFCLNIDSETLERLNKLIIKNKKLDNCLFVATLSNADKVREFTAKNIFYSIFGLKDILSDYIEEDKNKIMTITSDIRNDFFNELYAIGPKPSYRLSEVTVEILNNFYNNGIGNNIIIGLSSNPVNEFEILNKILLDPRCKYNNFVTFVELDTEQTNIASNLNIKLVAIQNISSVISLDIIKPPILYPDLNPITLYNNCAIQLVNNNEKWLEYIEKNDIFNRFTTNINLKSKRKKVKVFVTSCKAGSVGE
jgi:hypothetical protein